MAAWESVFVDTLEASLLEALDTSRDTSTPSSLGQQGNPESLWCSDTADS